MSEVVGGARGGGWADLRSVRWGPLARRALWLAVAFAGGGLLVGPLTNVVVRRLVPAGDEAWGGIAVVAAIASAAILAACWIGLALLTEDLFALNRGRCWALVGAVWGLGSIPWLLPASLSLPAHAGWGIEATVLVSMAVPFGLIAVLVCPGVRGLYRGAALLACVGVAAGWPALSNNLVHRAADGSRTALGAPAGIYLLVDVPGHKPYAYTHTNGVLQADYEAPGFSSPMRDTVDLLLTVCPSSDPVDCDWGETKIASAGVVSSCTSESGGRWWCTDPLGGTTLAVHYGGVYVSLSVDPSSETPVPASHLDQLIKTLHRANDRELLDVMAN